MTKKPPSHKGVPKPQNQAAKDAAARLACSDDAQAAVRKMVQQMRKNRDFSLEQARDLVIAFAESGDFDLLVKLVTARLPYEHARKEPEPPAPTGIVSDEPEPLSEEEFCARHGVDR